MEARTVALKNGQTVTIRHVQAEDAAATIQYIHRVAGESDNLTFGPGEHPATVESQIAYFEKVRATSNAVYLVATVDGEIVGMMNFEGGNRPRNQHVGEFGISVRQSHWGLGLGRHLLQALIDWAREGGVVRKINLRVRADNDSAVALYEKLGFVREGLLTRNMYIDGQFVDAYFMGLEIG